MGVPHAVEVDRMPEWSTRTELIAGGVRLVVVAKKPDDTRTVARIRGLGFAGLITEGRTTSRTTWRWPRATRSPVTSP
jgi:hypothetical protein